MLRVRLTRPNQSRTIYRNVSTIAFYPRIDPQTEAYVVMTKPDLKGGFGHIFIREQPLSVIIEQEEE